MAEKIIGVYKITNTITNDFYIGSSKNVKCRWANHKCPSKWNEHPNNPLYLNMKKYGVDKFVFEILAETEVEQLKEKEQQFIETLKPTYNRCNAKGLNIEKYKEYQREYYQQNREKYKEHQIEYYQQNREKCQDYQIEYYNQLCRYNGEVLTLNALAIRFYKTGVEHPVKEAKKYILTNCKVK